jgi:hypothetical protein
MSGAGLRSIEAFESGTRRPGRLVMNALWTALTNAGLCFDMDGSQSHGVWLAHHQQQGATNE